MNFKSFFERNKGDQKEVQKILPQDVRYALEHNEAKMGKREIETLLHTNFESEAVYLALKSLQDVPEIQKNLMEKYINFCLDRQGDRKANLDYLDNMVSEALSKKDNVIVEGDKLAQISRQGFDLWQGKFKSLAKDLSNDSRSVYLIAHSMLLGLAPFSEEFSKNKKRLNILIPSWIEEQQGKLGYRVDFKEKKAEISYLSNPTSEEKNNAVLVDDVIRTGQSSEKIKNFWKEDGSNEPTVLVVVNLK